MSKPKIRLVELLAEKSIRDGKLYTISDIESATGIERRRLYVLRDNSTNIIRPEEIQLLCDYFVCHVNDLIEYVSPLADGQEIARGPVIVSPA